MQTDLNFMQSYYLATRKLWMVSFALLIITSVAVSIKIYLSPELIALRYNVIVGVDQVGGKYELLKIPFIGLLLGAMNFFFASMQRVDKVFLPFLAALMTAILNGLLLVATLFLFRVS